MKYINERLGVPDNIIELATEIYDKYYEHTKYYGKLNKLTTTFYNTNKVKIGDIIAPNFDLEIKITTKDIKELPEKYKKGELYTLGFSISSKTLNKSDFKNKRLIYEDTTPVIYINIVSIGEDVTNTKLSEYFKENKSLYISSISHELMHFYSDSKIGYNTIDDRSSYSSFTTGSINIKSIKDFWFYMYFISSTEEVVRSAEVAGDMIANNISKKDFRNFISNNDTYKKLQIIKNYTYDKLIESIKQDINDNDSSSYINKFLAFQEDSEIEDISNKPIDYKIEKLLKYTYLEFVNDKGSMVEDIVKFIDDIDDEYNQKNPTVPTNMEELLRILTGDRSTNNSKKLRYEVANNIMRKIVKYENNPADFFTKSIKSFKSSADKTIKKISKLYDMAKEDISNDKSIKDWDLHQAINNRGYKYIESFKEFKIIDK